MFKVNVHTLGPIDDSNHITNYEPYLDCAFEDEKFLNIAITAPKGAGKSSILKTYLANRERDGIPIKTMNISVGAFEFEDEKLIKDSVSDRTEGENKLINKHKTENSLGIHQIEIKILNQIIHQINPKNIPEGKFHIDREHNKKKSFGRGLVFSLLLLCGIYLLFYQFFNDMVSYTHSKTYLTKMVEFFANPISFVVMSFVTALLVFIIVIMFFKNYACRRFPKLTIKDCAIEPAGDEPDSMFNKYIDEILYMLSKSEYEALVFEDLERLNDYTIWEKLREINYILNKRLIVTNKSEKSKVKQIKFVYVTTDSIFKGKDRVKFFDFIIPIVPIVDKSNSLDIIGRMAKEHHCVIEPMFLGSVTEYIDDMRLINNIFNEFEIYKKQLENIKLDDTKLFAALLYKNLLPKDFEKFQYNSGIVYDILTELDNTLQRLIKSDSVAIKTKGEILSAAPITAFDMVHANYNGIFNEIIDKSEIKKWNINQQEVIKYLISFGYITLEEREYISYFYPHTISQEENEFILNVKKNAKTDMAQKLEHVDYIASKLNKYFDSVRVLNFDLVYYILSLQETHHDQIYSLIKAHEQYEFIAGFINYLKGKDKKILNRFIVGLNYKWREIFVDMSKANMPDLYKEYIEFSLLYCSPEWISTMNINNCLVRFLNNTDSLMGE